MQLNSPEFPSSIHLFSSFSLPICLITTWLVTYSSPCPDDFGSGVSLVTDAGQHLVCHRRQPDAYHFCESPTTFLLSVRDTACSRLYSTDQHLQKNSHSCTLTQNVHKSRCSGPEDGIDSAAIYATFTIMASCTTSKGKS